MSKWKNIKNEEKQEHVFPNPPEKTMTMEEIEIGLQDALSIEKFEAKIKEIQDRRKAQKADMYDVGRTDYYFTVCFNNLEQLQEFCKKFGLDWREIHMDGRFVARALNRALSTPDKPRHKNAGIGKEYRELAVKP